MSSIDARTATAIRAIAESAALIGSTFASWHACGPRRRVPGHAWPGRTARRGSPGWERSAAQDAGLLLVEFCLRQQAGVHQLAELGEVGQPVRHVVGRCRCGGRLVLLWWWWLLG